MTSRGKKIEIDSVVGAYHSFHPFVFGIFPRSIHVFFRSTNSSWANTYSSHYAGQWPCHVFDHFSFRNKNRVFFSFGESFRLLLAVLAVSELFQYIEVSQYSWSWSNSSFTKSTRNTNSIISSILNLLQEPIAVCLFQCFLILILIHRYASASLLFERNLILFILTPLTIRPSTCK